jgi:hypothetical protein
VPDLLDRLARSPVGQRLFADELKDEAERRAAAFRDAAAVTTREAREEPRARAKRDKTAADVQAANDALRAAHRAHAEADLAHRALNDAIHRQRQAAHAILEETAPVAIPEQIARLEAELEQIRRAPPFDAEHRLTFDGRAIVTASNSASVHGRARAIRAAIESTRELALVDLNPAELEARLAAIVAELPAIAMEPCE